MALFSRELGIDLGTFHIRVAEGNEIVLQEPTVAAIVIDEQKMAEEAGKEEIDIPTQEVKTQVAEKKEKPEENVTFRGPTRIYYELKGRHHVYLPIPIYKCEGAGQITLTIEVDQKGNVVKAEPAPGLSTTRDQCLTETAVTHAFRTRFNSDLSAPERQAGFLTFVFVSQR